MLAHEEETHRPRMLNLLIGVTLATIVIALWYLLDYYLRETTHEVTWYPPAQGCERLDTVAGCSAGLGVGAALSFSLREADDASSLVFEVNVSGVEPEAVDVEFIGRDANVHSQRFALSRQDDGSYVGYGDLGVCSDHIDVWRAQVSVQSESWWRGSWFDFDTDSLTHARERREARQGETARCLWIAD
ncbi:hypothetical protein [Salinicola aestuarinus]|uniref:hypothetical protein n=1 Tax=Salinicola aestuarinus TaxID=1949082 RepID=UPI001300753C|nr:hypothetical protein [Salinicola aestuarinus]